jgi:hypothetical protein
MGEIDDKHVALESAQSVVPVSQNRWSSIPPFIRWFLGIVAGWIVTELLLSNAWKVVPSPWGLIKSAVAHPWTPWILTSILLLLLTLLYFAARLAVQETDAVMREFKTASFDTVDTLNDTIDTLSEHIDILEATDEVAMNILRLQSNVLWSLDNLVLSEDVPLACNKLIKMILLENAHLLDSIIFRCYVLRPDGEYLTSFIVQQMPEPEGYNRRFYIGSDRSIRRGIAGKAFVDNSLEIARRIDDADSSPDVAFDHEEYITLDESVPYPQYRSIICVPLRIEKERRLGVLCLDSQDPTAFDDPNTQQYLSTLGILIAFILDLSDKGQERQVEPNELPSVD